MITCTVTVFGTTKLQNMEYILIKIRILKLLIVICMSCFAFNSESPRSYHRVHSRVRWDSFSQIISHSDEVWRGHCDNIPGTDIGLTSHNTCSGARCMAQSAQFHIARTRFACCFSFILEDVVNVYIYSKYIKWNSKKLFCARMIT